MTSIENISSKWSFKDFKKNNVGNGGEKRTSGTRIKDFKKKISDDSSNSEKTRNNDEWLST